MILIQFIVSFEQGGLKRPKDARWTRISKSSDIIYVWMDGSWMDALVNSVVVGYVLELN